MKWCVGRRRRNQSGNGEYISPRWRDERGCLICLQEANGERLGCLRKDRDRESLKPAKNAMLTRSAMLYDRSTTVAWLETIDLVLM